jgi:secreted trypsin-like serine protease
MTTVQLAHHTQGQEVYHTVTGNAFDELSGIGKDGAVSRSEICVVMPKSNPHTGPCYGDIGLPLTAAKIKGRTGSWLLGLSHSDHCSMHLGLPAVFTRVSSSLQWIRATVPLLGAYPEQFKMTLDILQLGLPDGAYLTVHSGTDFKEESLVDDGLLDSKCQVRWGTHM